MEEIKSVRTIRAKGLGGNVSKGVSCSSPVEVLRTSKHTILLLFDEICFTKELLAIILRGCLRGQSLWRLYSADADKHPGYSAFLVQAENHLCGDELEEELKHVVEATTRVVYRREVGRRCRKIPVTRLPYANVQHQKEIDPITRKSAQLLRSAGHEVLEDLAFACREELCRLPGMTTREVFVIELNLASMGFYLMTSEVPLWSDFAEKRIPG